MQVKLVLIAFSITRLYCLWAYLCSVGSRFCRQQHRRALRLVIKFLLCTTQYRHSTGTVQAQYSEQCESESLITANLSSGAHKAHTPHRPYPGMPLSPHWPGTWHHIHDATLYKVNLNQTLTYCLVVLRVMVIVWVSLSNPILSVLILFYC